MRKKQLYISSLVLLLGLAGYTAAEISGLIPYLSSPSYEQASETTYPVVRVVDGDTIVVEMEGVEEKVRLIGIDTPESVHPDPDRNVEYGKIASDFTKEKLEGNAVALEFDVEERDQYGRLLAYVYLDGQMFNETLLAEGHAVVATYPPNVKYVDRFTELQTQARESGLGLWATEEELTE